MKVKRDMSRILTGTFRGNARAFGFVSYDGGDDIFIPPSETAGAMNGDIVAFEIIDKARGEGSVVRVLDRAVMELAGTISAVGKTAYFIPDDKNIPDSFFVEQTSPKRKSRVFRGNHGRSRAKSVNDLPRLKDGQKVWAKITSYPKRGAVKILEVFGDGGSVESNIRAILKSHRIKTEFSENVMRDARDIARKGIHETELMGREDMRDKTIFTIDGADTKDIDDAISLEKTKSGWLLGVHIADVSHYVKERSFVDVEAFERGTSVYYGDSVIPMLPKELSNGICSLNENEDRLALSVLMDIDGEGTVTAKRAVKSVIRSRKKCVYSELNDILAETADEETCEKYGEVIDTVRMMAQLAQITYKARMKRGAVELETVEAKVVLDRRGNPVDIIKRERGVCERMIEEFMLLANESVAKMLTELELACVYRVHEEPDEEKLASLVKASALFGINGSDIKSIVAASKGKPYEKLINDMALRSMMRAKYSEKLGPHFGLASPCYCHFTSPIRRYPDLFVHRMLSMYLADRAEGERAARAADSARKTASQSTELEMAADEAERDIDELYKVAYMLDRIGEDFDATVSGVTQFGIFAELDNTVEGLIRFATMTDDVYFYDEDTVSAVGQNMKKTFRIGDKIRVKCENANLIAREIDFSMV